MGYHARTPLLAQSSRRRGPLYPDNPGIMEDDTAGATSSNTSGQRMLDLLIARDGLGMHDGLAASERLTLFRTNKALAVAVLQQAPCTMLSLGVANSSSSQAATTMQLAAHAAPRMVLAMHGRLTTPIPDLWQRITTLSLHRMQLSLQHFDIFLRLDNPQHLDTLRLTGCKFQPSNSTRQPSNAMLKPTPKPSVLPIRALICIECSPAASYLPHALSILDLTRLLHLTTNDPNATTHLPSLPQLQQLHAPQLKARDPDFRFVLSHPTLTHVTLGQLTLCGNHSKAQPPSLEEVHVVAACTRVTLARLPLAHLTRCVISRDLKLCGVMDDMMSKVAPYQDKVHCRAVATSDSTSASSSWPSHPTFTLSFQTGLDLPQIEQAISMCSKHLQGTLAIQHPPFPDLVPALQSSLPLHITTLALTDITFPFNAPLLGSLINQLPAHVGHVILSKWHGPIDRFEQLVRSVTRTIRITLHHCDARG